MKQAETPLTGGNVNTGVVRVGDTVRRALTAASPAIHRLLRHLEASGFTACPRFLGIDDKSREILSYIDGETGVEPSLWETEEALVATALMLRALHDATATYRSDGSEDWAFSHRDPARHEVICHNDFAPYNFVFAGGVPIAVFDFDLAGPGPRLWDVAYAAFWMVPLAFHAPDMKPFAEADLATGGRRLKTFCDAYRVPDGGAVLDMVSEVLDHMADARAVAAVIGEAGAGRLEREGHFAHWQAEKDAFERHKSALLQANDATEA